MSFEPKEPGWFTASRRDWTSDQLRTVVRLSQDHEGAVALVWQVARRDPEPLSEWKLHDKIRMSGDVRSVEIDRLQREAHADGVQQGRAEAEQYQRDRERECPVFTADMTGADFDADFREVGEPLLAIRMTAAAAAAIDGSLSDLLCWARGFKAALGPDDLDRLPMGVESVRRVRETLNKAQRAAEKKDTAR